MQQGGEPTLEQILASIKRVMVRSDPRPAAEEPGGPDLAAEHLVHPGSEDAIEPAAADGAADVLELAQAWMPAPAAPDDSAADHDGREGEMPPAPTDQTPLAGLARTDAASAVRQSLAALELLSRTGSAPQPQLPEDAALEALTRALLRPLLAEWLDANLPRIVEQQVQAEIARIVGR